MYDPTQQCHPRIARTQGRESLNFKRLATLVTMLISIMLFAGYLAITFYRNHAQNHKVLTNNSTGKFPLATTDMTPLSGSVTPSSAYTLGLNDVDHVLAFSDELNYASRQH